MAIFGIEHILYLVVVLVLSVISIILIKKFVSQEKVHIAVKITSSVLLVCVICSRIFLTVKAGRFIKFIPDTFCSMMGVFWGFCCIVFQFVKIKERTKRKKDFKIKAKDE